ncbi:hypothetical protein [Verticiella sediminum]|uniref:hypothetical protein n=1 Tax=Verticiella sediminum TaxID=1247510 RepID=UPI001B86BD42|nr:hypothetical protein [Verticiella sediminum]
MTVSLAEHAVDTNRNVSAIKLAKDVPTPDVPTPLTAGTDAVTNLGRARTVQSGTSLFALKGSGDCETLEMVKAYAHLGAWYGPTCVNNVTNVTFAAQSAQNKKPLRAGSG